MTGRIAGIVFLLTAIFWVSGAQAAVPVYRLAIAAEEPEREVACMPIAAGQEFQLEFINSIYLAPVAETMIYRPGEGILLVRVESPSAGVFEYYGLPTDGTGVIMLQRKIGEMKLRSHDYQHHRVRVGENVLRLKGLVADGEPLVVKVERGECRKPRMPARR